MKTNEELIRNEEHLFDEVYSDGMIRESFSRTIKLMDLARADERERIIEQFQKLANSVRECELINKVKELGVHHD